VPWERERYFHLLLCEGCNLGEDAFVDVSTAWITARESRGGQMGFGSRFASIPAWYLSMYK